MERLPSEVDSVFDVWKQAGQHIVKYLIWLLCCILGFALVFLLHENLEEFIFLRVNPWHLRAYEKWSIYALGMIWIVAVFLIEGYLRRSQRNGRLLYASLIVLSSQLALIVISAAAIYDRDFENFVRNFLLF